MDWDELGTYKPESVPVESELILVDPLEDGHTRLTQVPPHQLFRKTDTEFFKDDWKRTLSNYKHVFILCYTVAASMPELVPQTANVLWLPFPHKSYAYPLEMLA